VPSSISDAGGCVFGDPLLQLKECQKSESTMFVTGCHRSGTSLVASLVTALLASDETPVEMLSAALDNPGGFHESTDLVSANEALLARMGASWDRPPLLPVNWCEGELWPEIMELRERFSRQALQHGWVDKDPRLAITASAYQHILLRRPGLIAVLREPYAVADSLHARDGIAINDALCLWWIYNLHLASNIRQGDLFLFYEDLSLGCLRDEDASSLRIFLENQHGVDINAEDMRENLGRLSRPDWRRSSAYPASFRGQPMDALNADLYQTCQQAYQVLRSCGQADVLQAFIEVFACLPAPVLTALTRAGWQGWPAGRRHPREELLAKALHAHRSATLWRATAPIRIALRLLSPGHP
jgi:hypothetical protein